MLKIFRCAFVVAAFAVLAAPVSAGELRLTINNGLVTVIAEDVPISRILSEWARIGQTKIVNGEKLMTPVSLELIDMPEKKALEIVLRSASGFMAAERKELVAGASTFDRIMILPFSQAPAYSPMPVTQSMPQPFVNRPVMATPEFRRRDPAGRSAAANACDDASTAGYVAATHAATMQPMGPGQQPQQPQMTSPRPGFLPPPGPPKPPGGGGGANE